VERRDGLIGSVTLGLRGEGVDQEPGYQASHRRDDGDEKEVRVQAYGSRRLPGRVGRVETGDSSEHEVGHELDYCVEDDRPHTGDHADENAHDRPFCEVVALDQSVIRALRPDEPSQPSLGPLAEGKNVVEWRS